MMEPSPAAPFKMSQTDLLLEFLVIPLDAPSELGDIDQAGAGEVVGEGRQHILGGLLFALGPFDQQPFLGAWILGEKSLAMGGREGGVLDRSSPTRPEEIIDLWGFIFKRG